MNDSLMLSSLDDVETKLAETEREAETSRKDSKQAKDHFNDVKKRRYANEVVLIRSLSTVL